MTEKLIYTSHKLQTFFVLSVGVAACSAAGYYGYKAMTEDSLLVAREYHSKLLGWSEENDGDSIRLGDVALGCMQTYGVAGFKNIRPNPENPSQEIVVIGKEATNPGDIRDIENCLQSYEGFDKVKVVVVDESMRDDTSPGEEFWEYAYKIHGMIDETLGEIKK